MTDRAKIREDVWRLANEWRAKAEESETADVLHRAGCLIDAEGIALSDARTEFDEQMRAVRAELAALGTQRGSNPGRLLDFDLSNHVPDADWMYQRLIAIQSAIVGDVPAKAPRPNAMVLPAIGSIWMHAAGSGPYRVTGYRTLKLNNDEPRDGAVLIDYESARGPFARPVDSFEARFTLLAPAPGCGRASETESGPCSLPSDHAGACDRDPGAPERVDPRRPVAWLDADGNPEAPFGKVVLPGGTVEPIGFTEVAEGKERTAKYPLRAQAGDWHYDDGTTQWQRWYVYGDDGAAGVDDLGWKVWHPKPNTDQESADGLASGPENGTLGQCLADLVLCAHGFLAWERIQWASDAAERAGRKAVTGSQGFPDSHLLTPATLDVVLTAVREVSRG